MGSYNETCMLSHLQIVYGDDVKLIILVKNSDKSDFIYHNEMYAPLCLPIDAKYNDYGGIKDAVVPDYTESLLNKLKFSDQNGLEEYKFNSVDDFVNNIIEGSGLYLSSGIEEPKKLECVYVHKGLYSILVDDFSKRIPIILPGMEEISIAQSYYTKLSKIGLDIIDCSENSRDDISKQWKTSALINRVYRPAAYGFQFTQAYFNTNSLNGHNYDKYEKELTDYIMFDKSLQFGRYGYLTKCGLGGQDLDVRIQSLVAKFTLDFSQRLDEDQERVYTEDEDFFDYDDL